MPSLDVVAVPAPDVDQRPARADRRKCASTHQRGVVDGVDAAGSLREHRLDASVASRHDDVCAEAAHELLVRRSRVGEHPEAVQLRDRDHVRGEEPRPAGDEERRSRVEAEKLQTSERRQPVHRQRRRLLDGRAGRNRDDRRSGDDEQLRLRPAVGAPRCRHGHHLVPDREMLDAGSDRLDGAGGVHAGNPWRRHRRVAALPQADVRRVDRGRPNGETHLTRPRIAHVVLDDAQNLRPARLDDRDRARHSHSRSSATVPTVRSGLCASGTRSRSRSALMPLRTRTVGRPAEPSERDVEAEVVADHRDLLGADAEQLPHHAHRRLRRLPDDDRPRAARLRDRRGDHRAAAEDRAVRAGVRRDVARGEELRAGDDGAGGALELFEVHVIRVRDEDRVDLPTVVDHLHPDARHVRARRLARERDHAHPGAVRLHRAQGRQHLPVRDRQPRSAQLLRERSPAAGGCRS